VHSVRVAEPPRRADVGDGGGAVQVGTMKKHRSCPEAAQKLPRTCLETDQKLPRICLEAA
jgi:hypothetical protein